MLSLLAMIWDKARQRCESHARLCTIERKDPFIAYYVVLRGLVERVLE
jgi:hypothetical protein